MGDIGRRRARFEVLPLAGGRQVGRDLEDDDAAWVADAGLAAVDAGRADTGSVDTELVNRRPGARTEPARS